MNKFILNIMVLAIILINGIAQAELLPSQVDMKVGYCLQFTQETIDILSAPTASETEEQKKIIADMLEILNANLRHFQRYIVARLQDIDQVAFMAAKQQAKDDIATSESRLSSCVANCDQLKPMYSLCLNNCTKTSIGSNNCRDLSFLPF